MVEYPIQVRWPYSPPIYRAMRNLDWLKWFSYQVLFLGCSADYIRVFYAYAAFSAK